MIVSTHLVALENAYILNKFDFTLYCLETMRV